MWTKSNQAGKTKYDKKAPQYHIHPRQWPLTPPSFNWVWVTLTPEFATSSSLVSLPYQVAQAEIIWV